MLTFLFWNTGRRPLEQRIASLVAHHSVDVLMLCEDALSEPALLTELENRTGASFYRPWSESEFVTIYTRLPERTIREVHCNPLGRLTVSRLVLRTTDILLAAVHFQSKLHYTDDDQAAECHSIRESVTRAESEFGHRRTVLVGDLNMNPFEKAVVSSHGLHAVMTKDTASGMTRTVAGSEYPFFYNPMWGCLGDQTVGPPGTYYRRTGAPICYFWNTFDQVLVRPDLLEWFAGVSVLDSDGSSSLLSAHGRPDKMNGSDHLPILFKMKIQ